MPSRGSTGSFSDAFFSTYLGTIIFNIGLILKQARGTPDERHQIVATLLSTDSLTYQCTAIPTIFVIWIILKQAWMNKNTKSWQRSSQQTRSHIKSSFSNDTPDEQGHQSVETLPDLLTYHGRQACTTDEQGLQIWYTPNGLAHKSIHGYHLHHQCLAFSTSTPNRGNTSTDSLTYQYALAPQK